MKKRIVCCILAIFTVAALFSVPCAAAPSQQPNISGAKSVLLYNLDSSDVILSKQSDKKVHPAATVKMMVALVAIDYFQNQESGLDTAITVPAEVIRESQGLTMELRKNEILSARDLIAGMIIAGANDAAYTLALKIDNSIGAFLNRMNQKAAEWGMKDTVYYNVSGLDYLPSTTANDLLILAKKAFENKTYMELAGTTRYTVAATEKHDTRTLYTRNYLLSRQTYADYYYAPANGMNAGATDAAGYCIVASARVKNQNYLCIVMGAENFGSFRMAKELIEWASKSFGYRSVLAKSTVMAEIPVSLADASDYITVITDKGVTRFLPLDLDMENSVYIKTEMYFGSLTAPVKAGLIVGKAIVYVDGEEVATVDLVTSSSLAEDHTARRYLGVRKFFTSAGFIWTAVIAVIICIAYVLIVARIRYLRMVKQVMEVPDDDDDISPPTPKLPPKKHS